MKTANAWSTSANIEEAVQSAYTKLKNTLGGTPDWLALHASVKYDPSILMKTLREVAQDVPVHGGTSCLGVMTQEGFHSEGGTGLGLFGLKDDEGKYGIGTVESASNPRDGGATAARKALAAAGNPDTSPALIWLTCAPGHEEDILRGIQDTVGEHVPIVGGSSADNTIEGHWKQFAEGCVYSDGIVVTAMFPSTPVHSYFWSGYFDTEHRGIVTEASGRVIQTIDRRPAAEVYNEWTGGAIVNSLKGGNVLGDTTLYPLGRPVQKVGGITSYRLSHPESVTQDGGLRLFTDIQEDDEIVLMTGSPLDLIVRSGVVAKYALKRGAITPDQVAGSLIIFCAGCMLTVQDKMDDVVAHLRNALGNKHFLGIFTFGEQGCFMNGVNYHGNLMMSVLIFERD